MIYVVRFIPGIQILKHRFFLICNFCNCFQLIDLTVFFNLLRVSEINLVVLENAEYDVLTLVMRLLVNMQILILKSSPIFWELILFNFWFQNDFLTINIILCCLPKVISPAIKVCVISRAHFSATPYRHVMVMETLLWRKKKMDSDGYMCFSRTCSEWLTDVAVHPNSLIFFFRLLLERS